MMKRFYFFLFIFAPVLVVAQEVLMVILLRTFQLSGCKAGLIGSC